MKQFSEEAQAAFRELFAAIEKQYGPIESVHFCNSFEGSPEWNQLMEENTEEEEYCCECGTGLSRHERSLCYDCQQDQWYNEDQDYYDGWGSDWDLPIEEIG